MNNFSISVHIVEPGEDFRQSHWFKEFEEETKLYRDYVLEKAKAGLTESELEDFEVWWTSPVPKEFWSRISPATHSAIHTAISWGLG